MVEFVSKYREMNYKIPESEKHARFTDGRLFTNDSQVISYLREHPDYGQTLTDVGKTSRKIIAAGVDICPVCGKICRNKFGLKGHLRTHKKEDAETMQSIEEESEESE